MFKYTAKNVYDRALSIADLQNSQFINWGDAFQMLNSSYRKIYNDCISNGDLNYVNDYTFIMPSNDVIIRATWTKQLISKSMNGTIAEKRTVFLGEVKVNKYVYNDNKNVISETMSENGIEGTSLSYEYDEYNNPVKVHHILNGNIVYTDEYQYTYDENGLITYKIWKNRFSEEIIFKTWFEYDEHGNLTLEKEFQEGADVPSYEKYYYDENNRLIRNESYIDDKLLSENIFEYEFYTSPPIDVNS